VNCIVCVTSVPDTASVIKIGAEGNRIDETGIKWILGPYDEYALEEALKITEARGGEVTAVTYGPDRAEAALRDCLARGAHKAVHVIGGETTLGDSAKIAEVLAAALKGREYDLILTGVQGVGTDSSQVGQMLAERLGLPHVAGISALELGDGTLTAEREVEGGREVVGSPVPALLTCQKGLNEPRYAALKGIMAAKRKPVEKLQPGDLGIDESAGGTFTIRSLELPPPKSAGTALPGADDPAAAARELVRLLREEAKAI
jgi:electron transfer flavoprotein beta subunit